MFTIMIVEDDDKISTLLQSYIEKYGYKAVVASDYDHIMAGFQQVQPDLVILDVNLPRYDGFYWCRQIRAISTCPILFISAREGKMEQVMALDNGADDYITKPFHYEVVMAKIKSHLRRAYGSYANKGEERTVQFEGLLLFPERLELSLHGRTVEIGSKESKPLEALMERQARIVSRDRLLEKIWDDQMFIDDNTLNVYVTRVRKKLKELHIEDAIETVRGEGYILKATWRKEV